ncbi:hypothetical protein E2C01_093320 [Portunus trituberculatus]|uniref:Uncharacterized protein n=1 Tax=Portunus trituberculatus TaxID=210409 RepID=A0A5B7JU56_PORTR|nr:hypothetical protein [Portunus trituberculatus]
MEHPGPVQVHHSGGRPL